MYRYLFSLKRKVLTFFFNRWYLTHPPEMVSWWKKTSAIEASIRRNANGHAEMYMGTSRQGGEKYPFPGFPRGSLLYGKLSPLKHQIKNQIFNDSWWRLEGGEDPKNVVKDIKGKILDNILQIGKECVYDMLPPEKMVPSVREIHRAFTTVIKGHPQEARLKGLRDILCFILNEDDGYRMRAQDFFEYLYPESFLQKFLRFATRKSYSQSLLSQIEFGLTCVEHSEVLGDMKERIRLLKRILLMIFQDDGCGTLLEKFCKELNWKKVFLTKADKFYFRGKYYRVDYRKYDY